MLVFVPLTTAELQAWAESGRHRPAAAHAVTEAFVAAFGFTPADGEDAEHTVLHIAGLAALLRDGRRLVAVAEAAATPVGGAEFGDVRVGELGFPAVTALFADSAPEATGELSALVGNRAIEAAWDDPEVADFLSDNELSWHGPTEWMRCCGG